jgi:predicted nucleotidyltransferase component of viral defense system
MAEDRLKIWETLFRRALALIESARKSGTELSGWSFGGGTVLMRRFRHRFSKDVDIFVPDPQYFGYLTPRLNDTAEAMTADYVEDALSLKLRFAEGEIDFIASAALTRQPTAIENLFGVDVAVETSTEIVAKKIWHRASEFKARDILDVALIAEREPRALEEIRPVMRDRRETILRRIAAHDAALRDDFAQLELIEYRRGYDECVAILKRAFAGA